MKAFRKTISLGILTAVLMTSWITGEEPEGKPPQLGAAELALEEREKQEAVKAPNKGEDEADDQNLTEGGKSPKKGKETAQRAQIRLYDIPLSDDLQEYTFKLCQEEGINYELTLALMDQESSYRSQIISETKDYGLMQINAVNHKRLEEELGISDFLDPKQNIRAGTSMLGDLFRKYEDPHKALMAYNFGEARAKRHWEQGTYTSKHSRSVMAKAEALKERRM